MRRILIGSRQIGFVSVGPGFERLCDIEVSFGVVPRRDCPQYEIRWHLSGGVSWDWPRRIYQHIAPAADVPGSSAAWTGREIALVGIAWRRWRLQRWFTYIPRRAAAALVGDGARHGEM